MTPKPKHKQRKLRLVGTPSNPTKFLRDGARYGAIAITDKFGTKRYYLGAQTLRRKVEWRNSLLLATLRTYDERTRREVRRYERKGST